MRLVRVANKKPVDEKGVIIKDLTKYFNLLDKNNGESN